MMPPKETRCAEGRGRPEGEPRENARGRTQRRVTLPANLARVNAAARRDKNTRFTALYVNWVLDADVRSFFDSVDHEWMLRMVAHRIATSPILARWPLADLGKPQEEPSAGKPPARICEGEAEWLNYSTTTRIQMSR